MAQPNDLVTYHRRQLREHANDPATGRCPICDRSVCPTYVEAAALVAHAGGRHDVTAVEVRSL